jgi:hypothetical protein
MLFSEHSLASSENCLTRWNNVMWAIGTSRRRRLLANIKGHRWDLGADGTHKQGKVSVEGSNHGKNNMG